MAYLFLDDVLTVDASAGVAALRPVATPIVDLTRLEWAVVALASLDRLSTLRKPGRFGTACGHLFGKRQNPELAAPRLEALRRVAVLMWHDIFLVTHVEHEAFIAAGFTQRQYDLLVTRVASYPRSAATRGCR